MKRKVKKKNEKLFHKQTSTYDKIPDKKIEVKIIDNSISVDKNTNNNNVQNKNNNFLIELQNKIKRTLSEENLLKSIKETENLKTLLTEKNEELESNKQKYVNEIISVNNNIKEKSLQLEKSSKNSKTILNKLIQLNIKIKEKYEKMRLSTFISKMKNDNENNKVKENYAINQAKKLISQNTTIIDKYKTHKKKLEKIITEDKEEKLNNLKNELELLNNNEQLLKDEIKQLKLIKDIHEKKCIKTIDELNKTLERIKNEYKIELQIKNSNKSQSQSFSKQLSLPNVNKIPKIYKNILIPKEEPIKEQIKTPSINTINNKITQKKKENKNKEEFKDLHDKIKNQINKKVELDIKTYIKSRNNNSNKDIENNNYLFSNEEKNILKKYIPMDCIKIYQNKFKTISNEKNQIIQLIQKNKKMEKLNKEKNQLIFINDKKEFNIQKKNIELNSKILQVTKDMKKLVLEIKEIQKKIDKIKDDYNAKNSENDKLKKIWIAFNNDIKNKKIVIKSDQFVTEEELNYINKFGKVNVEENSNNNDKDKK